MLYLRYAFVLLASFSAPLWGKPAGQILDELVTRCREVQVDSALVLHNDNVILEYSTHHCWQPLDAQGITGAFTALAIGFLIDEGKIESVDTPVYTFFPEWNQGNKARVTIRDLLANTSGLYCEGTLDEIHRAPNCVKQALCAEMVDLPGWCCRYNPKGINLLAAIVQKASGQQISQYLRWKLFEPLGCAYMGWLTDEEANEYGMSHLIIHAPDLAKIGKLIEQEGCWQGKQLLSKKWIQTLSTPGQIFNPYMGLLWYLDYKCVDFWWDEHLIGEYEKRGVDRRFTTLLRSLQGRVYTSHKAYMTRCGPTFLNDEIIAQLGGPDAAACFVKQVSDVHLALAHWRVGALRSIRARGINGQELVIYPGTKVITVRQIRGRESFPQDGDPFPDFNDYVHELIHCMNLYQ